MMFDVISVGSATLDVFIKSAELQILKSNQFLTGQAIAAPYGAKCNVEKLAICSGGGGTNTAVGFSRLGLKAAVVARCGWDYGGKLVRKEMQKEGVDDSLLVQLEKEETDYSTILIGPDGGTAILVYRGGTKLDVSLIDFNKLKSRWFCISGLEGNLGLLEKLVNFAKKNKIKVAINPGRREIEQKEELLKIVKEVDVFIINQEEETQLGGIPADFKGMAVVTRGAEGVKLTDPQKGILIANGFKMEMVDATGAGDGFFCGLVAGLVKKWPLEKALKLGIANGASVVTEIGAKTALLTENNYHNWLEKPLRMAWRK